jgi:transcriptional regulator with XRE-family HTH domain
MLEGSLTQVLLFRLAQLRRAVSVSESELERRLVLGPGWIERFESGESVPSIDMIAAMLNAMGKSFNDLVKDLKTEAATLAVERHIRALPRKDDLDIYFKYAKHDAHYLLKSASLPEFEGVLSVLRNKLASSGEDGGLLSDAVAECFSRATQAWPHVNPSDLWYFLVYRAYCDPYNHPAIFARKDFDQSWKRTGGWALEKVFVNYYRLALRKHGINIYTGTKDEKLKLLASLGLPDRLEADKLDIVLTGNDEQGNERFFGMVHVKASFAERRTDDQPMSQVLIKAGFTSILLTMDCKATPSSEPINRGELGQVFENGVDVRSAKRKDIEQDGYFSACFSYNSNTRPTPSAQEAVARIHVLDFNASEDEFTKFVVREWSRIQKSQGAMLSRTLEQLRGT